MASKSSTTLASSPPKPSTVAPTSVWSLLGEQGFKAPAFSNFFEPSVAEGGESIEHPKKGLWSSPTLSLPMQGAGF